MTDTCVEPNEKQPKLDEYFSSYEDLEVTKTQLVFDSEKFQSTFDLKNIRKFFSDT